MMHSMNKTLHFTPLGQPMFYKLLLLPLLAFGLNSCTDEKPNKNKSSNKTSIQEHLIASIPEASGISYCQNSNTLVVANDEGSYYEINPEGAILTHHKLGKYDLEGVVCEAENFIFALEDGAVLVVSRANSRVTELPLKGKEMPKINKKSGIEGIAKIGDEYYLTIQSEKEKDAQFMVVELGKKYAKVKEVIDHGIIDSAGMEYRNNKLYIVSDTKDTLYVYDLKNQTILEKIKLSKFAQEGITFDNSGNVFFADDEGAILRYKLEDLGL